MFYIIPGYTGVKRPKGSKTPSDHEALFQFKKNKKQSLVLPKKDK
jgi:hypothetical protein